LKSSPISIGFLTKPPTLPLIPFLSVIQSVFFEQQPQLRRLVDFVVDTVSANSALAAQLATCPEVVKGACAHLSEREDKDVGEMMSAGRFENFVEQVSRTSECPDHICTAVSESFCNRPV
jgi:hypothetical protein